MGESVKQLSKEFEGHKKVYKVFSLLRRTSKKKILLQSGKPKKGFIWDFVLTSRPHPSTPRVYDAQSKKIEENIISFNLFA